MAITHDQGLALLKAAYKLASCMADLHVAQIINQSNKYLQDREVAADAELRNLIDNLVKEEE